MMRILFLILLLANVVAFFLFGSAEVRTGPQPVPMSVPATRSLQLLSELTPQERADLARAGATTQSAPAAVVPAASPTVAPAASSAAKPAAATLLVCASYGPFPGDDAARSGAARLQKEGATVAQRMVPGKVRLGYWVYLPSFRTRKQAEAAENLLKKRGIKDLYIVADEANRNAISLGVYSQRNFAVARQKQLRHMGFHPLLSERFRDTPNYWLDARGTAAQLPAAGVFSDLAEGNVDIKRSDAVCSSDDKP
ncbi:MAG TPA: SPOR domain-containing protein [Gammaproteobacteria bacterium]|nr:SPOR domain-containing protein [Gammaproteobacteria bacterium]